MKSILIISYVFPPYPGIGGRRWAKFAKYLSKYHCYKVHVIASKNPFTEQSNWVKDIENNTNISVHTIPSGYPSILLLQPNTVKDKIRYRAAKFALETLTKGNIYDRSIFWKNKLIPKAIQLIKAEEIDTVIATGAPFKLLYLSTLLKKRFPKIKLITDFRDPWLDNKSFYGYADLSEKRKIHEAFLEEEVVKKSDYVTTVSEVMTNNLRNKYEFASDHIFTIPNGFDPEEFSFTADIPSSAENKTIEFIFAGNLYPNLEYIFLPFVQALKELKDTQFDLYKMTRFSFYGNYQQRYVELSKQYGTDIISFLPPVTLEKAHQLIKNADFCMLFLNQDFAFSMSTKFCEYLALRRPIITFSEKGLLSEFIEKNSLGIHIGKENIAKQLVQTITQFRNKQFVFNSTFPIEDYTVDAQCKKLISLIESSTN